ncbi:MAG TPA: PAS domain S-box protein, partial [Steroidobacteraceae bacterium]|nr:PAS domain S-box protein [Steroidobacteraceae bacterium]
LCTLGLVAIFTLARWTPVFFVQGQGGTPLRQFVLGAAIAVFLVTAVLLRVTHRRSSSTFVYWYALALGLLAIGLFGVLIQTSAGSLLGWTGRATQYLGGVYMLLAAITSVRESRVWEISLEESLRRSEERYRAMFNATSDGVWLHNLEGKIVEVNDAYCRMSGYSREEMLGMPFATLEAVESPEEIAARTRRILEGGGHDRFESRHRRKDGSIIDVDITALHLQRDGGQFAVFVRDITERKRAERALRESEARLNRAQQIADVGSWEWDLESGTLLWSEQTYRQLGEQPGQAPPRLDAFLQRVHPEDRAAFDAAVQKALASTSPYDQEFRIIRPDGTVRVLHARGEVLPGSDGRPRRMVGVSVDITAHKQAETRLAADLAALTRMHALSGKLLEAGGLQPLLQEVMDAAVAIVGAERGTLQLLEGDSLRIVAHHGHRQPFLDFFASAESRASVCGEATKRGERVVVPDVEKSPLFAGTPSLAVLREAGVRAVQSTPMRSRTGELLGILTTQWGVPHCPDEHALWRIDLLVRQAADLIEYTGAEAALRMSERRLAADLDAMTRLHQLGTLFLHEGNLEPVLAEIVDAAIAISGADFGNIQLLDPESGILRIAAQRGFPKWWIDFWEDVSKGQGTCGTALEREERVIVEDLEQSEIFAGTAALEMQRKAGVRAVQSTPLMSRSGKPLGMFSTHYRKPHRPDDRSLRLLDLLARHAADIIERARTEKVLRESEERLQLVLQAASIGTFEVELLTGEGRWNAVEYELLGLKPGDVEGGPEAFFRYVHPDDVGMLRSQWEKALETGKLDAEFRVVRAEGQERWLAGKGQFAFEGGDGKQDSGVRGRALRFLGVNFDISERKQAEEQLRASERLYRAIGETIDYGIWVCDAQGRNTYASESFLKLLGITQQQCSEFGWGDLLHPDDLEATVAAWKECVKSGGPWYREHRFRGADGQWHPILACGVAVRDERGQIVCWAGINLDISRLKQAEEALRRSELFLQETQRIARLGGWRANPHTDYLEWTKEVYEIIEACRDHRPGLLEGLQFYLPEYRPILRDSIARCLDVGEPFQLECEVATTTGKRLWTEVRGLSRVVEGERSFVIGTFQDITERKQAEERLRRANAELEQRSAEMEQLVYTVSHDLKSPLVTIQGFLGYLAQDAESGQLESLISHVRRIQGASSRMARLIEELLDISRVGRIANEPTRIDLTSVVGEVVGAHAEELAKGGIKVDIQADMPAIVGDRVRVHQVFDNLLVNSI